MTAEIHSFPLKLENTDTESVKLHLSADEYFEGLISDLKLAKHSIDIEMYIFSFDELGQQIIEIVKNKSLQEDVNCRILIDGVGSSQLENSVLEDLELAGVEVKIFHPLPWRINQFRRSRVQGPFLAQLKHLLLAINKRNHRKLCVIDQDRAWVGSMNISADHLSHEDGLENWRDCGIHLQGQQVRSLSTSFEEVWLQPRARRIVPQKEFVSSTRNDLTGNTILLNDTVQLKKQKQAFLKQLFAKAESRIWISNAYFSPLLSNIKMLQDAAIRGVDIRIVTGASSDVPFFPLISSTFYPDLLRYGVKIYEYNGGILHSKVILVDDTIIVGSSNMNHRSLLHDLELDIVVNDPEATKQMQERFSDNFLNAERIKMDSLKRRGIMKSLLAKIYRLFIYWL